MKPLWEPHPSAIKQTMLWRFMAKVNTDYHLSISDYFSLHEWSVKHISDFWESVWTFFNIKYSKNYTQVLTNEVHMLEAKWFSGARFNFAENILRYCHEGQGEQLAMTFYGENKVQKKLTYTQLYEQVTVIADVLKSQGVEKGDRVVGFMPNMPESVIAMLATTSIGAVWSSCSPDFGLQGVYERFSQITPKVLFTADGYYFRGKSIDSLKIATALSDQIQTMTLSIVVPYLSEHPEIKDMNNAVLYSDLLCERTPKPIVFEQLPFDHPLYILYSSGTTGVPKCIVHGAGGTLLQHLKELSLQTELRVGDRLFYYTTCGWMMWNWMVSGLGVGATLVLYDGSPFYPKKDRLFDLVDDEKIQVFGTSAKYLSALDKNDISPKDTHKLDSLRVMLSTGSPLSPESFRYVYREIKSDMRLSSISGGTDIISCFSLGSPILPVYPGELQCFGLGMDVAVYDDAGNETSQEKGELVCKQVFPSMPVCFWDDVDKTRYRSAYFDQYGDVWSQGDYAQCTSHKGLIIHGRSDAVLNPGGVRIGSAEIYRQVEKLPEVIESIAIGQHWKNDIRIVLFVKLVERLSLDDHLKSKIRKIVRTNTTTRHVPSVILAVKDIPRTLNGKIVELAVANVIHHRKVKNIDALINPEALAYFKDLPELAHVNE